MPYFPMFTDLKNKKCLVVGGGNVAKRKANTLIKFGADVLVIASEIKYDFNCKTIERDFCDNDIYGNYIVVAATDNRDINKKISALCHKAGINVNVADSSDESTFIFGASIVNDNMVISVNSGENNPSKSKKVKEDIMNFLGNRVIRIGTRKSKLALAQTNIVAKLIKEADSSINCEIVEISTKGDKNLDKKLTEFGGKGAFTGEIEKALLENRIDIAVHSGKDLPINLAEGLDIISVTKREKANDVLVKMKGKVLNENSVIGTGSIRRSIQLNYKTKNIRGNVDTRLLKMEKGEFDGVVLAYAGLKRLGLECLEKYEYNVFNTDSFYPAPCQGIIAIEAPLNSRFKDLLHAINDYETFMCFNAERGLVKKLGLGCQMPIGAYSYIENNEIILKAAYLGNDIKYFEERNYDSEKAAENISDKIKECL